MTIVTDIKKEEKRANKYFNVSIFLIVLLTLVVIGIGIIVLLTSKRNYIVSLLINAVLTTLYLSGLLFYFQNIYSLQNHYRNFYKLANKTTPEVLIVKFKENKEDKVVDGVIYKRFSFEKNEHGEPLQIDLFTLDSDVMFNEDEMIKVICFRNVILSYEVYHAEDK